MTVPLTSEFVVVGNHLAQHPELSLVAIGVSVHIQSLPPGRRVGIKALAERFQEGAETIARAMRELERCGYLDRPRDRVGEGRFLTRTIAYNHPDAAHQDRAFRKALAERKAAERKASGRAPAGRRSAAVPQQRAGSPAVRARHHGIRAARGQHGGQQAGQYAGQHAGQRPVRQMCTAADALRELWQPEAQAAVEMAEPTPAPQQPAPAPAPPMAAPAPAPAEVHMEPPPAPAGDPPQPETPEAVPTTAVKAPDAPTATPTAAPQNAPSAPAAASPVFQAAPQNAPAVPAVPDAPAIRASLARAVPPPAPSADELARLAVAVELLAGLRARDHRLVLSEKEVEKLAPALVVWLERGVRRDAVSRALLEDLPPIVKYPAKFVGCRLADRLPPPLPTGAGRREAPREPAPGVALLQNCEGCDRAFRSPAPGRCDRCVLADTADPGLEPSTG
ncbi:hypothetical protein [Streptomyces sp. NBC_00102]|uniref:hypothetical protein n=1 Tax=Streptomyces sp. NBC_00102 TaxID=2975652 RepID=UPI0022587839|nr:hypothetical protein [Streptomyces sp. NBC_00102]MCX5397534.1 helix-turn-helix domain-containing protein [Streptomyces sp. NBC_00102]